MAHVSGRSERSRSRSICSTGARCSRRSKKRSPTRSSTRRPRLRMRASPAISTAPSRRPTGCGPRGPTTCWPPRARPACPGSSHRASPACATPAMGSPSRARTIRSTPTPRHPRARRTPPCGISIRRSRTPAGSRFATAASTALRTTGWSSRCASGSCRSSVTAAASSRSSTSTTPPRQPCSRSSTTIRRSTTSSTTSQHRCGIGCRCSRARSVPSRPAAFLAGSRLIAGEVAVIIGTESNGASNAKAKRELGWTLRYPSWRQGFPAVYGGSTASGLTAIPTPARG
jgi:hypothetical protein